jgi:hypothetical protein
MGLLVGVVHLVVRKSFTRSRQVTRRLLFTFDTVINMSRMTRRNASGLVIIDRCY